MIRCIADTHALIWYLFNDPRLSTRAIEIIDTTRADGDQIGVSSISLVEIVYLIEKQRVDRSTLDLLLALLDSQGVLIEVNVDRDVVAALSTIPRDQVPDMPDRIIAATAVHLGVPLISRDRKIQASSVTTIW
jgi:PIN domain nuclease of toxin-antitoxin system